MGIKTIRLKYGDIDIFHYDTTLCKSVHKYDLHEFFKFRNPIR